VGDFPRWPLLPIDVITEQGIVGRSYLAPYLNRAAAALLPAIRDLGTELRGRLVTPAAAYEQARRWFGLAGYQGLAVAAVAGLDIALWDALAKSAGSSKAACPPGKRNCSSLANGRSWPGRTSGERVRSVS
jgi:mandelate racemase